MTQRHHWKAHPSTDDDLEKSSLELSKGLVGSSTGSECLFLAAQQVRESPLPPPTFVPCFYNFGERGIVHLTSFSFPKLVTFVSLSIMSVPPPRRRRRFNSKSMAAQQCSTTKPHYQRGQLTMGRKDNAGGGWQSCQSQIYSIPQAWHRPSSEFQLSPLGANTGRGGLSPRKLCILLIPVKEAHTGCDTCSVLGIGCKEGNMRKGWTTLSTYKLRREKSTLFFF